MYRKLSIILMVLLIGYSPCRAQQEAPVAEFFCGAELNYADVNFQRLYNVLINATPGGRVRLGKGWEAVAQMHIPVINDGYASRFDMVRLSMANVSKEVRFDRARQYFKLAAGLFGKERYGGDLRWMFPINSWLMVHARLGLTENWAWGTNLKRDSEAYFYTEKFTFTALAGASIWLNPWATELRATGGRYMNRDYGVEGEIIRHFKHCSVSIFAQLHELAPNEYIKKKNRYSGGFRIVMMIPPYKKSKRKVVIRPASNFRLTYNAQSDGYSMRKYTTDPEENERTYPIQIPWGTGNFNE